MGEAEIVKRVSDGGVGMRVVVGVATVEGGIEENDKDEAQRNARGENNE